jgi:hypothetical protein
MIKPMTGLFDSMDDAQSAAKELMDRGVSREDISLVARDTREASDVQTNEVGAAPAAGAGAVVGGTVGLLVGVGLLAIPGIGPILAIGPLAAAIGSTAAAVGATALGAGIGAGVGGIAGGLMSAGVSEEDAHVYAEGVRRGGTLLTVNIDSAMAERVGVDAVMRRYGVTDIDQRSTDWRSAGWDSRVGQGDTATDTGDTWKESSKVGTAAGTVGGAATGAAIGSVGGPVGTVIGGAAGAVVGAGAGATGDVVGERSMPVDSYRSQNAYDEDTSSSGDLGNPRLGGNFAQYDQDFHDHYRSTALSSGHSYDDYVPAYRFGYDQASDMRYANGTWDAVENDLRRDWEQRDPNSWVDFKAAVRYAWEKARGLR